MGTSRTLGAKDSGKNENEMKLEEVAAKKGTYAGVRFSNETLENLAKYIEDNDIPDPHRDFHCTLLFSRKVLPKYDPIEYNKPLTGKCKGFELFNEGKALVLRFDCPELVKRHKELMDEHKATYDYDEYLPHVTLSYDASKVDVDELPKPKFPIVITKEYKEELTL